MKLATQTNGPQIGHYILYACDENESLCCRSFSNDSVCRVLVGRVDDLSVRKHLISKKILTARIH